MLTGLNQDFQFSFTPGFNKFVWGQTLLGANGLVSARQFPFTALAQYDSYRCVAACARVVYLGSESARSGQIGSSVTNSSIIEANDANVGTGPLLPLMQKVSRLGEVVHETKWVPSVADQNFIGGADTDQSHDRGTITITGYGLPAATASIEMTAVYEVIPEYNSGLVASQTVPPSRNSLGDVLRAMGDASAWAFSNVVAPVVKASAGMAMQHVSFAPQLLAGATRLALNY